MTISLAFLAPNLVKAAVEGRLPRGIGIVRFAKTGATITPSFEALIFKAWYATLEGDLPDPQGWVA